MRRQVLNFVGLFLAIALSVVGCQQLPLPINPPHQEIVTIKLSGWGASPAEQKLLRSVLQDFSASHPHIHVKYEVIADQYMDVLKTRLVGDAAPDVFYLDALEAPFLMQQGVLEPLNDYVTPDFEIGDFEPRLLNSFQHHGKIYGFPKDCSTLALFYNQKAFADVGLDKPPQTWEELRIYAKKLTRDTNKDGKIDQYGLGEVPELARHAYKINAFGGEVINSQGFAQFYTPASINGLKSVIEQYRQERTSVQKTDVGTNSPSEMFGQGKVAMVIEGNWAIPYLKSTFPHLDFATAELPKINNRPSTMVYTVAYVMNAKSQHKQAAWELISYLTGKEGMEKWTGTGFALPTRKSVATKLGYDQDILRAPLVAGVDYATPWQVGEYPTAIVSSFDNQFISAMLGQQSLPQALQRAQNDANKLIKALKL